MNKQRIEFTDIIDNKTVNYEVLYIFKSYNTNKEYIIYTDNTKDNDNNLNIYAAIYLPDGNNQLQNIELNADWDEIENFLSNIVDYNGELYEK